MKNLDKMKPCPSYPWLFCDEDGNIFSTKIKRFLTNKPNKKGYISISFSFGTKLAHRLVAEAFLGKCPPDKEVNHINGIKSDNRISNLEYVTKSENAKHACRLLLKRNDKENNPRAKLTMEDVKRIKEMRFVDGLSFAKIAETFDVTPESISNACRGKTWK